VTVNDKSESDAVYEAIKSEDFFVEYRQSLLDSLQSDWALTHYTNASLIAYGSQIESMQESPTEDIGIVSPTHSPTAHPTYDYEAGEHYGWFMICSGGAVIVGVMAYAAYRRYVVHQDYKREMKSAMPHASVELQSLFDTDTSGTYKLADS